MGSSENCSGLGDNCHFGLLPGSGKTLSFLLPCLDRPVLLVRLHRLYACCRHGDVAIRERPDRA